MKENTFIILLSGIDIKDQNENLNQKWKISQECWLFWGYGYRNSTPLNSARLQLDTVVCVPSLQYHNEVLILKKILLFFGFPFLTFGPVKIPSWLFWDFYMKIKWTRLIYYGVETMYFVVFVVKSALKVIPSIIIFTRWTILFSSYFI